MCTISLWTHCTVWKKTERRWRGTPCGSAATVLGSRWVHCYAICWKLFKMGNPRYCIFKKVQYLYIHIPSVCCVVHFALTFGALLLADITKWQRTNLGETARYIERGKAEHLLWHNNVLHLPHVRDDDTSFPRILNFWLG